MDRRLTLELPVDDYGTAVELRKDLAGRGFEAAVVCPTYNTYHVRVEVRDSTTNYGVGHGSIFYELQLAATYAEEFLLTPEVAR